MRHSGNRTCALGWARLQRGQMCNVVGLWGPRVGGVHPEPSGAESPSGLRKPGHMTSMLRQRGLSAEREQSSCCFQSQGELASFTASLLQDQSPISGAPPGSAGMAP